MFENRVQYTPPSFGPFVWRKWWVLEPGCISKSCSKSAWSMSMTWLWTDLWWRLTCLWIAYSNPWTMLKENWKPGNMRQNETNIVELPSWTRFCPLGVPTALYNHQQGAWKFCSHCSFEKPLRTSMQLEIFQVGTLEKDWGRTARLLPPCLRRRACNSVLSPNSFVGMWKKGGLEFHPGIFG